MAPPEVRPLPLTPSPPLGSFFVPTFGAFSGVAQLVEQTAVNRRVAGSSPAAGAWLELVENTQLQSVDSRDRERFGSLLLYIESLAEKEGVQVPSFPRPPAK